MTFNEQTVRGIAAQFSNNRRSELGLIESFVQVCKFLHDNPEKFPGRNRSNTALIFTESGLENLAKSYFTAYRRSDLPKMPNTVPDEIVSIVMMVAFGYNEQTIDRVKFEHQLAMSAENSVGALLERYLDSVLRPYGWHWCCGTLFLFHSKFSPTAKIWSEKKEIFHFSARLPGSCRTGSGRIL